MRNQISDNTNIFGTDDYGAVQSIYEDWCHGEKPIHSGKVRNRLSFEYEPENDNEEYLDDVEFDVRDTDIYNADVIEFDELIHSVEELEDYED